MRHAVITYTLQLGNSTFIELEPEILAETSQPDFD